MCSLFKSIVYSLAMWFFLNGLSNILKVTPLMPIRFDTAASNIVEVTVYGYVLAKTLQWLEKRYGIEADT